jgi:hypothetical protein
MYLWHTLNSKEGHERNINVWFKYNMDAAFHSETKNGATGVVHRDESGPFRDDDR